MLKVYNTLSGEKEVFKPRQGKKVNLFVCGPTVYDFSHLGHARTYLVFDMIVKYLKQKGYDVFYLQNITDIDDKIISRAREENQPWKKLSEKFGKTYLNDMKKLKIDSVSSYAPATKYIKQIINQVKKLLKLGFAYLAEDGVYYDITKFKDYGKLSKRTALAAEDAVSRIDEAENKKNKGDFCLWKKSKPGEPFWPSPWFLGRPGWHIEDTAITENQFGQQYDMHGAARDLIFPHHEAEIAQMEAISGKKPMVKYWLHTGFLTVEGKKMAKSLGNFVTIQDFLKKHPARLLRFFVLKTHYRSPIDYSRNTFSQAENESDKIAEFVGKLLEINSSNKTNSETVNKLISKTEKDFEAAMDDDFNTPKALAAIFNLINSGNNLMAKNELSSRNAKDILLLLKQFDEILGIDLIRARFSITLREKVSIKEKIKARKVPPEVLDLVKEREKYRKDGLWEKADEARKKVIELGYEIEDTKEGPKINPVRNSPPL